MPSGYTADVMDGKIDFPTFALRCARAFGATIMQRDENTSNPPRHREYSDFYERMVKEDEAELARLAALSDEEIEQEFQNEVEETKKHNADSVSIAAERRVRYQDMIDKVNAWVPPTLDHIKMRDFMIKQLTESIDWDCNPYQSESPANSKDWIGERIKRLTQNLTRHRMNVEEEKERVRKSNEWIDALYESLGLVYA